MRAMFALRALAVLLVLGALAALIAWPRPTRHSTTSKTSERAPPPAEDATPRATPATAFREPSASDALVLDSDETQTQSRRFDRVNDAIELLRFPPSSQRLLPTMQDVLHPNARHERPGPLSLATGATTRDPSLAYLFTADTYAAIGDAPITATLEVFRGVTDDDRTRVAAIIRSCRLVSPAEGPSAPLGAEIALNDDGHDGDRAAGDHVYGVTFSIGRGARPAASASLRLEVDFAIEAEPDPAHASLDFRVTREAPAIFTGVASERLTPDGLEVAVAVRVVRAGHYSLQGLLFDADDRPIGMASARPMLEAGAAVVPLLYWGLLFRDANARSPFTFRTLTGHRLPEGSEAAGADMATWEGSYVTRSYAPTDFSDKEYESPAKERKVRALMDLSRRLR